LFTFTDLSSVMPFLFLVLQQSNGSCTDTNQRQAYAAHFEFAPLQLGFDFQCFLTLQSGFFATDVRFSGKQLCCFLILELPRRDVSVHKGRIGRTNQGVMDLFHLLLINGEFTFDFIAFPFGLQTKSTFAFEHTMLLLRRETLSDSPSSSAWPYLLLLIFEIPHLLHFDGLLSSTPHVQLVIPCTQIEDLATSRVRESDNQGTNLPTSLLMDDLAE
jgi:hypothetical protein